MLELAVSLTIVLILSAIAIPTMMESLRAYQLNDAAGRVADLLKFTRFEAVRTNKQVNFLLQQSGAGWIVGTDSNRSGAIDPWEKQEDLVGFVTLIPAGGLPAPGPITAALNVGALTTLSGNPGSVTFDVRGAVRTAINGPLSANIYVIYLGAIDSNNAPNPDPQFGYRAVVVLPAGGTQVWTSPPNSGTWQRIS
jgi:hypothetical protein